MTDHNDFTAFAAALDDTREALSAMVAALRADGFSDTQARDIATAVLTLAARGQKPEEKP